MQSVRTLLKDGTEALHARAEAAFDANAPIESQAGLSHFLECMLSAHMNFYADCDRASYLAGLSPRSKPLVDALLNDLSWHDHSPPIQSPSNDSFSLGVGYVFEGSALGASILKKRIISSNLSTPDYLSILTASAKSRWPRYITKLNSCSEDSHILSGAVAAFEYIIAQAESSH